MSYYTRGIWADTDRCSNVHSSDRMLGAYIQTHTGTDGCRRVRRGAVRYRGGMKEDRSCGRGKYKENQRETCETYFFPLVLGLAEAEGKVLVLDHVLSRVGTREGRKGGR